LRCERQPGGKLAETHGVCPATIDSTVDGINGGKNGGRCCWDIAGTFCFGEVQGIFARKVQDCMDCDFFWLVADEEDDLTISTNCLRQFVGRNNDMAKTKKTEKSKP
jgi:hypothetical protein